MLCPNAADPAIEPAHIDSAPKIVELDRQYDVGLADRPAALTMVNPTEWMIYGANGYTGRLWPRRPGKRGCPGAPNAAGDEPVTRGKSKTGL